jgi:prepilin-type N-terminal cleavage/methylation domain-containing protein
MRRGFGKTTCGFSLIELVTSIAVGSIVLLTAASLLGITGEGFEKVGGDAAVGREGRIAITQLRSDLSSAVFHAEAPIEAGSTGWRKDRIGLLSLQPADAQSDEGRIGDLCAVHFYIKDLTLGGKSVRCLMRGFRESAETFEALRTGNAAELFRESPDVDEPLAFDVVAFEISPQQRDASGGWIPWSANPSVPPDMIRLRLVVARRNAAIKLRVTADWDGNTSAGRLIGAPGDAGRNRNLEVFEAMLPYGNHADD